MCALNSLKKKNKPYCILPSWTYVATAQAVIEAKMIPYFVDVSEESMQINMQSLKNIPKKILNNSSILLCVSPFGMPFFYNEIKNFIKKKKINFLLDAAAGFDSVFSKKINLIISFHATKVFGIGEGGMFYSPNQKILLKARSHSNFGYYFDRHAINAGVNLKLNEIQCAIGIAALNKWNMNRKKYYFVSRLYLKYLKSNKISFLDKWGREWVSSTCVIKIINHKTKKKIIKKFKKEKIQHKDWWEKGCHREFFFKKNYNTFFNSKKLVNTEKLSKTTLGIPFHAKLQKKEILKICSILNTV